MAAQGILNERGNPFNPKSIGAMLAGERGIERRSASPPRNATLRQNRQGKASKNRPYALPISQRFELSARERTAR